MIYWNTEEKQYHYRKNHLPTYVNWVKTDIDPELIYSWYVAEKERREAERKLTGFPAMRRVYSNLFRYTKDGKLESELVDVVRVPDSNEVVKLHYWHSNDPDNYVEVQPHCKAYKHR